MTLDKYIENIEISDIFLKKKKEKNGGRERKKEGKEVTDVHQRKIRKLDPVLGKGDGSRRSSPRSQMTRDQAQP